jgi:hypothetical protein
VARCFRECTLNTRIFPYICCNYVLKYQYYVSNLQLVATGGSSCCQDWTEYFRISVAQKDNPVIATSVDGVAFLKDTRDNKCCLAVCEYKTRSGRCVIGIISHVIL